MTKYRVSYTIEVDSIGDALVEVAYLRIDQSTDERDMSRISDVSVYGLEDQ